MKKINTLTDFANHYDKTSKKWDTNLYNFRNTESRFPAYQYKGKSLDNYAENTTGYQITYSGEIIKIFKILYFNFGISLKQLKTMSLVDLGCGYGGMLKLISPYLYKVFGVEFNPAFIQFNEKLFGKEIPIIKEDIRNINISADIFYTFNITRDKNIFIPILKNMKKGQIFIELLDGLSIFNYAEVLGFSKIYVGDFYNTVVIQK